MKADIYKTKDLFFVGFTLFILALLIRLPYLGTYMTIDEVKWVEGAGQFTASLANGNLFATYWHFFPGVTTTWGEALILWIQYLGSNAPDLTAFVETQMANLPGTIGAMRLSQVVITALGIAALYWLARPLLGHWAALLGAGLLATDPFFVAHSRIVNGDAASAILMMLAFLAFANLWQTRRWSMVVLSGVLAGLAMLTKLPAPIILAWVGLLAMPGFVTYPNWRYWLSALILFGAIAIATFVLLFPAMWVNPFETLYLIYLEAFDIGGLGEGHNTFFLGNISNNPGWFFYPYTIAFRLTPITIVGLLAIPFWLWQRKRQISSPQVMLVWAMLTYIIFVYLFANTSPKKLDRYLMAVIPPLLLLAGIGWIWLIETCAKLAISYKQTILVSSTALLIAVQALFVIQNYPYVLNYYNPLLGGFARAVEQVPVGWGEGMEQAADYLNNLPNAEQLIVSSWYSDMFNPYFTGQKASFSDDGRGQLSADYVVFYINQIQRQKPYPGLINYLRQKEPVFVVHSDGNTIDDNENWVEVYPAPAAQSAGGAPKVEGVAQLLAYTIAGNRLTSNIPMHIKTPSPPNNQLAITLYLQILGPLPDDTTISVALENNVIQESWTQTKIVGTWQEGNIVEWHGTLDLPVDMPPGEYQFRPTFQFTNGTVITPFPISEKDPLILMK